MSNKTIIGIILIFGVLVVGSNAFFTINQYERGLTKMFGKIERNADGTPKLYEPGINFKVPFLESVIYLDGRIQTLDGPAERVGTVEKIDMMVDTFVKWRIKDFAQYYLRTQGRTERANLLLEKIVNNALRAEFGRNNVTDAIYLKREQMMDNISNFANEGAPELGIEIVDVRVKQANYPPDVNENIYKRMRAERLQAATRERSEGKKQATIIRAQAQKEVIVIAANASLKARIIRSEADAKAAKIYATSFKKNSEFYDFIRSMEAYRNTFENGDDVMVISPDDDFFRYFGKEKN
jgi:membrane protease subunit HflC